MSTNFSTKGGVVTRGETFAKLLFHVREAQDQAAVMSHLENTEDGPHHAAAAKGWMVISEQLKRFVHVVTEMAKGGLQ
jgi:hypothetical protein